MLDWFFRCLIVAVLTGLLYEVWRRSPRLGVVIAAGAAVRLLLTVSLYLVSVSQVSWLDSYHSGDGFWQQAADARRYYMTAVAALDTGWDAIAWNSASPAYPRLLVVWMWMLGVSPLVAALLNTAAYVATMCVLALLALSSGRFSRQLVLPFVAVACAPALLAHGSQSLKDEIFAYAVVFVCIGVGVAFKAYGERRLARADCWLLLLGLLGMTFVGGVRFYIATLILGLVPLCLLALWAASRFRRPLRWATVTALTLFLLWVPATAGLGTRAHPADLIIGREWRQQSLPDLAQLPLRSVERARAGFEASGGRTNLAGPDAAGPGDLGGPRTAARLAPHAADRNPGPGQVVARVAVGLGAVFLPMSLLRACCGISLGTGGAVLRFADVDSLYALLMLVATAYVAWRHRAQLSRPTAAFVLLLSLTVLVLAAYAVTNYGTLFRLRMIGMVPLWLLPIVALRLEPPSARDRGTPRGHA